MKEVKDGFTIEYDDLCFAFNPVSIKITGANTSKSIKVVANGISIEKEPIAEILYFDLSAICRSIFDRSQFYKVEEKDTILCKQLSFDILLNESSKYSGTLSIIWGALQIGETYIQSNKYKYFPGYPFTLPVYFNDDYTLKVGGTTIGQYEKGKYNIPISKINSFGGVSLGKYDDFYIFDMTFDITFTPEKRFVEKDINVKIEIKESKCNKGDVYLRWLNRHGEYNYYLFSSADGSISVKESDIKYNNTYHTVNFTDNYHKGQGKSIGKNATKTIKLNAVLLTKEEFNFLVQLSTSPIVDQFVGYDLNGSANWISVNIKDATYKIEEEELQDISFDLIPNDLIVQTL